MKISYRREIRHNYLILDPESLSWGTYECRMMANNVIEGVLKFQVRQVDDEVRFYYEITSRQPLSRVLESRNISAEEIRSLVVDIAGILERMEQYLLREEIALLEPEYIYVDPGSFRIWLCLVPGLERDFPKDFGKLLEYLLEKVDHQDKKSVVLAYGLYQETRKENYGMQDILSFLRTEEPGTEEWPGLSGRSETPEQTEKEKKPAAEGNDNQEEGRRERGGTKAGQPPAPKKGFSGWWSGVCGRAQSVLGGKKKEREISSSVCEQPVSIPWDKVFLPDEAEPEKAMEAFRVEAGASDTGIGAGQTGISSQESDTALLAETVDSSDGTRQLRALSRNMEDIIISYYPFVIGKQPNLADYVLNHDTVSRLHLRIERKEEGYWVQDLNSTNGTVVSGQLLENNEMAQVKVGDEIWIADLHYRFE